MRSGLLSVLLHAGVAALVLWLARPTEVPPSPPVEIWDLPSETPQNGAARTKSRAKSAARKSLPLSALGVGGLPGLSGAASSSSESSGSGPITTQDVLAGASRRGSLLYRNIFERIDSVLSYPVDLLEKGLEGEVSVELVFNATGEFQEVLSTFDARSASARYFRVYLKRLMREVWEQPIRKDLLPKETRTLRVPCRFVFKIKNSESMGPTIARMSVDADGKGAPQLADRDALSRVLDSEASVISPKGLSFSRTRFGQALAWKLGPIGGYGIAPGIGLDPSWIADRVQSLFDPKKRGRMALDPLEKYRESQDY